jgi:hypothetical protein
MPVRHEFATDAAFEEALRNWFAGQAMIGLLACGEPFSVSRDGGAFAEVPLAEALPVVAYGLADAMLSTRSPSQTEEPGR